MLKVTIKAGLYIVLLNRVPVAEVSQAGDLVNMNSNLVQFADVQEVMSDNTDIWLEEPAESISSVNCWRKECKTERIEEKNAIMKIWQEA